MVLIFIVPYKCNTKGCPADVAILSISNALKQHTYICASDIQYSWHSKHIHLLVHHFLLVQKNNRKTGLVQL